MIRIKRKFKARSDGFTLVELIICMAIIIIMTGIATVTVTLINSARAKEAAVTFESTLSDTIVKSKSQVCVVSDVVQPTYMHCLKIYRGTDGNYYIQSGYYDPAAISVDDGFIAADDNANSGKGVSMSSRVTIKYTDESGVTKTISNTSGGDNVEQVYIVYNSAGRCINGYGSFRFYKKNGNFISAVTIQKNGSHQSD